MKAIHAGSPRPLGATLSSRGVNFALFSAHASRVEVSLFDATNGEEVGRYDLPARTGDVWHGLISPRRAGPGTHYAFHVHGPNDPQKGHRFDAAVPLIDPYARELSMQLPLRSRVVEQAFDWQSDRPPTIPWRDSILYELHVKGFTKLHPAVPERWRGKYLGLSVPAVIEHLKSIGVTAVELLPCQAFVSEQFLRERKLSNYWGYNPIAWFAPANDYALDDAVTEFKTMVRTLHAAGIEVILDVVFNHTAEGSEAGPLLSLRGIDNSVYYRLTPGDLRFYENLTGCGNTVNCEHPRVRALIVDCLKYWVEEMHVDGFRFDLATVLGRDTGGFSAHAQFFKALRAEPALTYVKLIAEPWDVGLGGYQLGRFPPGWSEWNDRYRDSTRAFWRGDSGKLGEFAERFAGSSDLFRHNGRKPTAGINFVTAHDGMTLNDLVSYNDRHNEANLDTSGHGNELSWNCGAEGTTPDKGIVALRKRQMRNFLATLFLSQGVPMLQAGDEFARTQAGNNNAYCQDNEISWVDWRLRTANHDMLDFVRLLARLRRLHVEFRRETFLKGAASRAGVKDVTWLNVRGTEMTQSEWHDPQRRTLGIWFGEHTGSVEHLLLVVNSADTEQNFELPAAPADGPWICLFDTAMEGIAARSLGAARNYALKAHSAALLEC
ncbi:MAG: isoamylase [Gammaproteobacteria bacterium]|nr:isoamylase [Gammaproteobacteria bacterium]